MPSHLLNRAAGTTMFRRNNSCVYTIHAIRQFMHEVQFIRKKEYNNVQRNEKKKSGFA